MMFTHTDLASLKNVLHGYFPDISSGVFDDITDYDMGYMIEREALWALLAGGNGLYPYHGSDSGEVYQTAVNRACRTQFGSTGDGEEETTACAHKLFYVAPDIDECDIAELFSNVRESSNFGKAFHLYNDRKCAGNKDTIIRAFIDDIGIKPGTATTYYFIIQKRITEMLTAKKLYPNDIN